MMISFHTTSQEQEITCEGIDNFLKPARDCSQIVEETLLTE